MGPYSSMQSGFPWLKYQGCCSCNEHAILKGWTMLFTHFSAAAAEHGCCAAAAASRRRELRLMTDVAESCAPFPLQLHHAHLQLHLLPLPLPLTDTDSTTVLDAHVFSPLHEFGASCPLPEIQSSVSKKVNDLRKISWGLILNKESGTWQNYLWLKGSWEVVIWQIGKFGISKFQSCQILECPNLEIFWYGSSQSSNLPNFQSICLWRFWKL